jgi:hypothetical protein
MMSKRFYFLLMIIAMFSLAVSFWLSRRNTEAVTANNQSRPVPVYVANFEERVAQAGRPAVLSRRILRAQRSDGTLVEVEDRLSLDGKYLYTTRNIYCSDGAFVYLRDAQRIGVALANAYRDQHTHSKRYDPARQCKVPYDDNANFQAASEMELVTSLRMRATRLENDSPTIHHRIWLAPSLGCLEVRRLAEFKGGDGSITDTSDYALVNLQMAEPPAALFEIPPDYESVNPTQFYERLMTMLGTSLDDNTRKALSIADAEYVMKGIPLSALK